MSSARYIVVRVSCIAGELTATADVLGRKMETRKRTQNRVVSVGCVQWRSLYSKGRKGQTQEGAAKMRLITANGDDYGTSRLLRAAQLQVARVPPV